MHRRFLAPTTSDGASRNPRKFPDQVYNLQNISLSKSESAMSEAFSSSAILNSAERICQFYLRGRCQRENCDFKHDPEKLKAAKAEQAAKEKDKAANEGSSAHPAAAVAFKSPAMSAAPSKNNAPSVMSGGRDSKATFPMF